MNAPAQPVIDVAYVESLLKANPHDAGAWTSLGVLVRRAGRVDTAIPCHYRGLEIDPTFHAVWSNLGNALTETGDHDRAIAAHERAYALAPDVPSAAYNFTIGLRKGGDFARTLTVLERARRLDPRSDTTLIWERALTRLQTGDYGPGLEDYEARYGIPTYRNRVPPGKPWDGGPLFGRTIFLSTEQGFGDALLTARYVPMVKARGGRVLFECHNELKRVLSGLLDGSDEFIQAGAPYPAYDVHASLMGLPRLLGTRFDTVPPPVRLSIPDEARAKAARLIPDDTRLKVGIVWSGRVTFAENHRRATTLARFLRFLEIPGTRFYSLQKGPPEEQLRDLGSSLLITPLGPEFEDFADTAAAIERLDLVLMTDSSVAHLAGSLGKPVWNLMQYVPYWIYGFSGESTPWYPSMRLFRQGRDEDWEPVIRRIRAELRALAEAKAKR